MDIHVPGAQAPAATRVAPAARVAPATQVEGTTAGPFVRCTSMLVEDGCVLCVHHVLRERSFWSLPGGKLNLGETIGACVSREMLEETGIAVEPVELLYVCDRFKALHNHVVDLAFLVKRTDAVEACGAGEAPCATVEACGVVGPGAHAAQIAPAAQVAHAAQVVPAATKAAARAAQLANDDRISEVRMVPFDELEGLGFSGSFARLFKEGLPNRGTYQGDFHQFYCG